MKSQGNKILAVLMLVVASIGLIGCSAEDTTSSNAGSGGLNNNDPTGWHKACKNVTAPGGGSTIWNHDLYYETEKNMITLISSSHSENLSPKDSNNSFEISPNEITSSLFGCVVRDYSSGTIVSTQQPFRVQIAVCINANQAVEIRHITHIDGVAQPISGVHCSNPL